MFNTYFLYCRMEDNFSIYFNHGGRFATLDGNVVYADGEITGKHFFDADRFGYFDIVEEVEKNLEYKHDRICYRIPNMSMNEGLRDIISDVEVMEMLKYLDKKDIMMNVYVQGMKIDI